MSETSRAEDGKAPPQHRTIDRVTQILEEVVYHPGISFAELARALDAPKSSVYGFIRGLEAKGWLHQDNRGFYLGPAVHGLVIASGNIRAGMVTHADLQELHEATGLTVFLGVEAGDDLIYVEEAGTDSLTGFGARSNIRRNLLATAGGKALLACRPDVERERYLRRYEREEGDLVSEFLAEYSGIKKSGIASNYLHHGAQLALATTVTNRAGVPAAAVILVGPTDQVEPDKEKLAAKLLKHVGGWSSRRVSPREAV